MPRVPSVWHFIRCDNIRRYVSTLTKMTQPTDLQQSKETLLQELLKTVSSLQNDVLELKKADKTIGKDNPRKQPRNSELSGSQITTHDGEDNASQFFDKEGSNGDPTSEAEDHKSSNTAERFQLSEEWETFLETVFNFKMEYSTRKAKLVKYGQPDSKRIRCSEIGSVVEGILSNEALRQDKVSYRSQQLWL